MFDDPHTNRLGPDESTLEPQAIRLGPPLDHSPLTPIHESESDDSDHDTIEPVHDPHFPPPPSPDPSFVPHQLRSFSDLMIHPGTHKGQFKPSERQEQIHRHVVHEKLIGKYLNPHLPLFPW